MRWRPRTGALVALVALACVTGILRSPTGAQTQPPRDPLRPVSEPTAILRGRVTAADTGRPIRGAFVGASPRAANGQSVTQTAEDGRYELRLPPGRYTIDVRKPGYVSIHYGQRRAMEQGTPIELAAGQEVRDINVALPRGGVLTGLLFDPFGDPVTGATVRALRFRYTSGTWRLSPIGRGNQTDDRGAYRIYGLPPGEYFVAATSPRLDGLGRANARGVAPTYYPGTSDPQGAQTVALDIAQELTGLDFRLTTTLTARVSGRVVDADGRPVPGAPGISLVANGATDTLQSFGSGPIAPDGTFSVTGVTPGAYVAYATGVGPDGANRFGTAPVAVSGEDVDGVLLVLGPGGSARGRIVFEPQTVPDFAPDALTPFTMPRGYDRVPVGRGIGHVNDDWTFEIRGMDGPQLVRLTGLGREWQIRTVALAGRDITDVPIVFPTRTPTTGLRLVLTNRLTTLTGAVVDARGQPATGYTAVIFAEDEARWVFPSRFIRATRPDQRGAFVVRGLPPARYFALAAQSIPEGSWTNPQFLERLVPFAERFQLRAGEDMRIALPVRTLR